MTSENGLKEIAIAFSWGGFNLVLRCHKLLLAPQYQSSETGSMQVNPRYVPQLQNLLQWPQSAGIVGGRPSSSLYFVGYQGQQVIYLDPHEVQEVRSSSS